MKRYFPLLILTIAFLAALLLLAVRGGTLAPEDGYRIETERSAPAEETAPERTLLNINTATAEELCELPGIGPALAGAIVEYRAEHGPFHSVDELTLVSGIGEGKLNAIRDAVTIGGEE